MNLTTGHLHFISWITSYTKQGLVAGCFRPLETHARLDNDWTTATSSSPACRISGCSGPCSSPSLPTGSLEARQLVLCEPARQRTMTFLPGFVDLENFVPWAVYMAPTSGRERHGEEGVYVLSHAQHEPPTPHPSSPLQGMRELSERESGVSVPCCTSHLWRDIYPASRADSGGAMGRPSWGCGMPRVARP